MQYFSNLIWEIWEIVHFVGFYYKNITIHGPLNVKMLCRLMYLASIPNVLQSCPSHRPWFGKISEIFLTSQIIKVFLMHYNVTYCQISFYHQIMSSELSPHTPNLCNRVCVAEKDYLVQRWRKKRSEILPWHSWSSADIIPRMICIYRYTSIINTVLSKYEYCHQINYTNVRVICPRARP